MTREQATTTVAKATGISGPYTDNFVIGLEALGLLKLEKAKPQAQFRAASDGSLWVKAAACLGEASGDYHCIAANAPEPSNIIVDEIAMVKALRMAGYEVLPK